MKFWKGKTGTAKEGMYGTMADAGYVPDSEPATKAEYDAWFAARPLPPQKSDVERLVAYAKAQGWI